MVDVLRRRIQNVVSYPGLLYREDSFEIRGCGERKKPILARRALDAAARARSAAPVMLVQVGAHCKTVKLSFSLPATGIDD